MARYIATRIGEPERKTFESKTLDDIRALMLADGYSYRLSVFGLDDDSESLIGTSYKKVNRPQNPQHLGWLAYLSDLSEAEGKRLELIQTA